MGKNGSNISQFLDLESQYTRKTCWMAHAFNHINWEAEAGRFLWVSGQSELHSETRFQKVKM